MTDADADPNNELIIGANLNGSNLEITDAGGTTSIDLSSLNPAETDPQVGDNMTDNFLPKWSGTALEQSTSLYEDGSGKVGIGTANPDAQLHVQGDLKIVDGNQGEGKILTSDVNGLAGWQELNLNAEDLLDSPPKQVFSCIEETSSLGIGDSPQSIAVAGNYAYIVDAASDDLKIIDVSDPNSPVQAGSLLIGPAPRSIAVAGNYAYIVDEGSDDLKIIDVSDPNNPLLQVYSRCSLCCRGWYIGCE